MSINRLKSIPTHLLLIAMGLLCITLSTQLTPQKMIRKAERGNLQEFAVPAALSFGHREFAWSLWAMHGLSTIVAAWHSHDSSTITKDKQLDLERKLYSFLNTLPEFSKESLGMREIFIFPSSYLAFVKNDTDAALKTANLGIQDPRLVIDLTLTVAYLTHLFKNDLNEAARAYEKVLEVFPRSTYLQKTIGKLRAGIDPFLEDESQLEKNCQQLLRVFPFARAKLIERKICSPESTDQGPQL